MVLAALTEFFIFQFTGESVKSCCLEGGIKIKLRKLGLIK